MVAILKDKTKVDETKKEEDKQQNIQEVIFYKCGNCGYQIFKDYRCCPNCGSELDFSESDKLIDKYCKFCGEEVDYDFSFCSHCGKEIKKDKLGKGD